MALRNCCRPACNFDVPLSSRSAMLGERSSRMIAVSERMPAAQPSQPLARGRLAAMTNMAMASIRLARTNHCRTRAKPRVMRLADNRNNMAAHSTDW